MKIVRRTICVICAAILLLGLAACGKKAPALPPVALQAKNLLSGAKVTAESLKAKEKPDAKHLLEGNLKCWTPQDIARRPARGQPDACNSAVEIKLAQASTFNAAEAVRSPPSTFQSMQTSCTAS